MPMAASRFRQTYGKKGYRPQSVLKRSIGEVMLKRGRQEAAGVDFNLFPALGDALPEVVSEIIVETTESVAGKADAKVPVRTGRLKASQRVRYSRSKATGTVITGRIDYKAIDPTENEPKHEYGFFVEVGGARGAAQPFLLPALISERQPFNARFRDLEKRLREKV